MGNSYLLRHSIYHVPVCSGTSCHDRVGCFGRHRTNYDPYLRSIILEEIYKYRCFLRHCCRIGPVMPVHIHLRNCSGAFCHGRRSIICANCKYHSICNSFAGFKTSSGQANVATETTIFRFLQTGRHVLILKKGASLLSRHPFLIILSVISYQAILS